MPSITFGYTSGDGQEISAYRWDPPGTPRAALQVTHGMGEHALRYEKFAQAMNDEGLVVYAQDHRGHGATAGDGELGNLGRAGGLHWWRTSACCPPRSGPSSRACL